MTDYATLVESLTSSSEPEFKKFSDWSSTRPNKEEDTTRRVNYADYLRKTYIDAGAMSVKAEGDIQSGLYASLVKNGSLEQGDVEGYQALIAPEGISRDSKLGMIQTRISQDDPDWTTITEFKEAKKLREEDPTSFADLDQLELRADKAIERQYDVVKKRMLNAGELPFISVTDKEGNRRIVAGNSALKFDNLSDALAASSLGDVSLSDAYVAQEQLVIPSGATVPRFKLNRYNEAKGMINSLVKDSPDLRTQIEAHAKNLAESEDAGVLDWSKRRLEDVGEFVSGIFDSESEENIDSLDRAQGVDMTEVIQSIAEKLNTKSGLPLGEEYNGGEIEAAYNQIVLEKATHGGMFEFYEGEEAGKNLRISSFGTPVVHASAMVNEDAFNDMLKARPDLPSATRKMLKVGRTAVLDQNFENYAKTLGRSSVDDEWNIALMQGRADGKANHKILNDFLANEDNYNEFTSKAAGVGASIIDSFGTLISAVPAAMGNEVAIQYLSDSAQRSSDRREVAQLFNQEYGYFQEILETVAPMLVDISATAVLAAVTAPAAGAGGAAYVAVRAGSLAAAKGVVKGVVGHTIKTAPRKILTLGFGKGKNSATLAQVIKQAVKTGDAKLTNDVMKAFNSNLAQKIGITSAVFVPAATRSGAATYGSITNHLRSNTDLKEEEIRDRALGAGFMSAAITGVITSGFSFMGRGGLDDALLRGMSFRELKAATEKVTGFAEGVKNATISQAIRQSVSKSMSKNGKIARVFSVGKNFTDEATEEGLDQFVNSFVEDAALDQDTPLLERLAQTFHAAMIGGIMGAGAPVIQKVGAKLKINEQRKFAQVDQLYNDIAQDVEANLQNTGSPVSAAVLSRFFKLSAREAVSSSPAVAKETPATDTEQAPATDTDQAPATDTEQAPATDTDQAPATDTDPLELPTARVTNTESAVPIDEDTKIAGILLQEEADAEVTSFVEELQQIEPEELRAAANSAISSGKAGLYPNASRPATGTPNLDLSFFQKGEQLTEAEEQEASVVLELANSGFPVRLTSSKNYGVPLTQKDTSSVSDYLAEKIYSKWPLIEPDPKQKTITFRGERITFYDPETSQKVKSKVIKGYLDIEGRGIFNNDPILTAQMLAQNIRIPVPDSINMFDINPSIKVEGGYVLHVTKPRVYGVGVEILGSSLNDIANAQVDLSRFEDFKKLPFITAGMDDTVMPHGATPMNNRGYSLPVGSTLSTYGDIHNSLLDYIKSVSRDPSLIKIHLLDSQKQGLDMLDVSDTGSVTPIFEAYHEYVFLLNLFAMRDTLVKSATHGFSAGGTLEVPNKKARNFAARGIATRASIDGLMKDGKVNAPLLAAALKGFVKVDDGASHAGVIEAFVNQQILNNASFTHDVMPTFPAILQKKVRKYIAQEKSRKMGQQNSVVSSFTDLNLDAEVFGETLTNGQENGDETSLASSVWETGNIEADASNPTNMTDLEGGIIEDPFAGSGPIDPDTDLGEASQAARSVAQLSIEEIDRAPELRESLKELFIAGIVPDASARQIEDVRKMTTKDIMSYMGDFLRSANYETEAGSQALKFKKLLQDGELLSQQSFKMAVYLNYLSNLDSNDPQFILGLRSIIKESTGREVSERDAIGFVKAIDKSALLRFSRSHVSGEQKAIYEAENLRDIERLGLESQNPESVVEALKTIAKTSDSKSHKLVANLLLEDANFVRNVSFEITQVDADFAGNYSRLTDGSHNVLINTKTGNGLGLENALLEEYVHAFLNNVANLPLDSLTPNQKTARTRLEGLFKLAENEYRKGPANPYMEDAFENFDEFLAKFLLSPKLQALIKDLEPPKSQRGFFTRILDALVSMFRKVSKAEAVIYTEALGDVIALSKSVARTQSIPISQVSAMVEEDAARVVAENAEMYEFLGDTDAPVLATATATATAQSQPNTQDANFDSFLAKTKREAGLSTKDQREMESLMIHLKSRIPYDMEVAQDLKTSSPAYAFANKIYVNPREIMAAVADMDSVGARVYVESVISEEVAHVASWNSLTTAEISNYTNRLSLDSLKEIAGEYYSDPVALKENIDLLELSKEETLTDKQEKDLKILKRVLAEEKLRMHLQKVTRGFTTEEDVEFWTSSPSLIQMLSRYFKGIFSRLAAMREMNGGSGALDSMLRKIHGEIQLINAGFNTIRAKTAFDTDNPEATMIEFKRFMENDVLGEAQDYGEGVENVMALATSSLPADSLNRIMSRAQLAVTDGKDFVDVEEDIREPVEVTSPHPWTGMDHGVLIQSIESLSHESLQVRVVEGTNRELFVEVIDQRIESEQKRITEAEADIAPDEKSKELKPVVSEMQVSLKSGGEIHVDWMATHAESAKGFSGDFLNALIVNADEIGAKIITTQGGGDYTNVATKAARSKVLNFVASNFGEEAHRELAGRMATTSHLMVGYSAWGRRGFDVADLSIRKIRGILETSGTSSLREKSDGASRVVKGLGIPKIVSDGPIEPVDKRPATDIGLEDQLEDAYNDFDRSEQGEEDFGDGFSSLPDESKQEVLDFAKNTAYELMSAAARSAKALLDSQPTEGAFDLFDALNGGDAATNRANQRHWVNSGSDTFYTFDLSHGSKSLKAFYKGSSGKALLNHRTNEKVSEIITEYRKEIAELGEGETIQEVKDKYNDIVMDKDGEIGLDFPLFASSRNPNPVSSGDKYDFSMIPELLEISQLEYKTYKSPEGIMSRIFQGDLGSPIRSMLDQRDEFKRGGIHILKSFHKKFNDIIKEDGILLDKSTLETIAAAQGYNKDSLVSNEFYTDRESEHQARVKVIAGDVGMTRAQKKAQKAVSKQTRDVEIDLKEQTAISARNLETAQALSDLAAMSPRLAATITSMRTELIQPIQEKIKGAGISEELRVRIDQTGGFYITRSFRMFNDPTFAQKVREDPAYEEARKAGMIFFEDDVKNKARAAALDGGKSSVEAEAAADKALQDAHAKAGTGSTHGEKALDAFIQRYESLHSGTSVTSNRYSKIAKNFSKRKDLPEELRVLLGEYGAEAGTDLIARTYATVSTIAAEQVFRSNIATVGKHQGFMVDAKTYAADPDKYPDFIEMKSNANKNDPFAHMYADKSLVADLADIINPSFAHSGGSTAEVVVSKTAGVLQNLTGKSMLLKTLGSVGFYLRNILGNVMFFGPANGIPLRKMGSTLAETLRFSKEQFNHADDMNAVLSEYVTLGVMGDELRAGMIKELLDAGTGNKDFTSRLNEILDEAPVIGKSKSFIAATEKKLMGLSASVDGAYKIAYYEHELEVLRKAKANHPNSQVGRMKDNELKRMAASNVKRTAQSLSQAPPIVRALSKSSYGMLFAPFIRFKAEVPRIVYNTFKLAKEEKASDNPDIVRRGKQRLRGLYTVIGGVSLAAPAALAALSGIGDEEDEALRKSMPSFLRGHSFYYWGKGKDLISVDLTYLNPFSLVTDPFARAFRSLSRGDFGGSVAAFVKGAIFDQYLDEQILAGAVSSAMRNENATTGRPIWISEVDGFGSAMAKGLGYALKTAYSPRMLSDAVDAYEAVGGDYNKFTDSPMGELIEGAWPVRTHAVDVERQYRSFLRDHQSRLRLVNDKKFVLYSDKPITSDSIRDIYTDEYEGRKKLNRELWRVMKGFESLGVSAPDQMTTMKQFGFGKDKAALLMQGVMDRLTPNKGFIQKLIDKGHADRVPPLFEARDKEPRYYKLED